MSIVEYCSFVGEDFIICDCGHNCADDYSLRSHLELDHEVKIQLEEPEVSYAVSAEDDLFENLLYIIEPEKVENVNVPEPSENISIKEECDESETMFLKTEFLEPEDNNSDLLPNVSPKVVTYNDEDIEQFNEIILVSGNEEHDYEREANKVAMPPPAPEPSRENVCEICGQIYHSGRALKIHMRRHVDENSETRRPRKTNTIEVICDLCGKKYKSNAALRYHTRVHTGEKPYHCVYCPKAFTMPLFLQLHTRTHTGERPYPCRLCEKKFSNKAALARHDRVHTGEKPYECQFCRKSFTQSNSMKLHITTVHLKLPSPYKSHSRQARQQKRTEALQALGKLPKIQQIGTLPAAGYKVEKIVTLPAAGYKVEKIVTLPAAGYKVDKIVTLPAVGYNQEKLVTLPAAGYKQEEEIVTVPATGYKQEDVIEETVYFSQ